MLGGRRYRKLTLAGSCLGWAFLTSPGATALAQDSRASDPAESRPAGSWFDLNSKTLTGDWGGTRTEMEDLGIRFKVRFMNQIMSNMHGGRETKNGHDTAGSLDFNIYFDLDKMNLVENAEFWIRPKATWGGDDSDFDKEKVGGLFKTNQDAGPEEPVFVDKWHFKQRLLDGRLEYRIGRIDPIKDLFDISKIIGHEDKYFLNRALVRNVTIPSSKGLGIYAKWQFTDTAYIRVAALDAESQNRQTNFNTAFHDQDTFRVFGELGCTPKLASDRGELRGRYRVGTWFDPSTKKRFFDTLGGRRVERFDSNDWGFYLGFDQMIWKENDDPKDKQGFAAAGRYGRASGEVNKIEHFWAAAVQYEGLVRDRDKDLIGFGVAQGILADEYRRVHPGADRETVYELYYAIYLSPWLTISPDLQYITNTGGDDDDPDTFVAGLRIKMNL